MLTGLSEAETVAGTHIAHAATAVKNGEFVATGGRVLSVVSTASDFAEARRRAYEAIELIGLEGSQHRTDIAAKVATA